MLLLYHSADNVTGLIDLDTVCLPSPQGVSCQENIPWFYTYNIDIEWANYSIVNGEGTQIAPSTRGLYESSNFSSVYNDSVWFGESFLAANGQESGRVT